MYICNTELSRIIAENLPKMPKKYTLGALIIGFWMRLIHTTALDKLWLLGVYSSYYEYSENKEMERSQCEKGILKNKV